jgi:bifunctional non-homologous end joining protein LigD
VARERPQLRDYRRKRDAAKTPEPFGGQAEGSRAPLFVVQRHEARRLHYDFRLERGGALASWAVPKGIPLETGDRRLAVHVEDHPLDYASFEGEIPKGQYGAGSVEIWDCGTYELLEEKRDGGLTVRLAGERLQGVWTLVPAKLDGDPKNWLVLRKDESPKPSRSWRPMLASSAESPPSGEGWVFEVKLDGYRAIATVRGGETSLTSRNGNDLTGRFSGVARAISRAVHTPDCVVDGEVCALDAAGAARFSALQQAEPGTRLVYYAFDVLERDGEEVASRPLEERRDVLDELVEPVDLDGGSVRISALFEDGDALLAAVEKQGLEGILAKRADSRYLAGRRSRDWLKVKTSGRQEFVVAGWTRGAGRRGGSIGALVLAVKEGGAFRYVGNVGTGFSDAELARLKGVLGPLERPDSPFPELPKMPRIRRGDVVWVEPILVAEVRFAEWTHDGHLRAPVYLGLRDDKAAADVRRERPALPSEIRRGRRTLKLSNLDKPFWQEEGITKGDLIAYYRELAPVLVPHLRDRPFTMKRYPDGWQGKHFFQKDAPKHMPEWIPRAPFPASTREGERRIVDYALVNDELALLWMANMGCIDLHAWMSRADKPDRPDWVLFDLDPSEDVGFAETVEVALLVRAALELVGLRSYPKTSGSRGIHVLVPIARRHTYAQAHEFASVIADGLARAHPGLVTTEWTKSKRRGVLVDANQNGPGRTTACVYSVRPRAGAPASTPLRWDEVSSSLDPAAFTMDAVIDRVSRDGDLFADVLAGGQSLSQALRQLGA